MCQSCPFRSLACLCLLLSSAYMPLARFSARDSTAPARTAASLRLYSAAKESRIAAAQPRSHHKYDSTRSPTNPSAGSPWSRTRKS